MIVECDRCSTRYRVREDKLPDGGGNIKCPSCNHVFFVKPNEGQGGVAPSMLLGSTGALPKLGGEPEVTPTSAQDDAPRSWKLKTSFGLVYDFPDTASLRNWLEARDDLQGYQLAIAGQEFKPLSDWPEVASPGLAKKMAGGSKPPGAAGPSKPLPRPGSGRHAALDPPVNPNQPSKPAQSAKGAPGAKAGAGAAPAQGKAQPKAPGKTSAALLQQQAAPAPPPRRRRPGADDDDDQRNDNSWITFTVAALLVTFVIVGLQLSGVIDLKKLAGPPPPPPTAKVGRTYVSQNTQDLDPGAPKAGAAPQQERKVPKVRSGPENPTAERKPIAPSPFGHQDHVKVLLEQAQKEMRDRDYDGALATLSSARGIAPREPEVYKLLERAYSRKGDRKAAREARDTYNMLKNAAASGGADPNRR